MNSEKSLETALLEACKWYHDGQYSQNLETYHECGVYFTYQSLIAEHLHHRNVIVMVKDRFKLFKMSELLAWPLNVQHYNSMA